MPSIWDHAGDADGHFQLLSTIMIEAIAAQAALIELMPPNAGLYSSTHRAVKGLGCASTAANAAAHPG